jgi:formylglycine-generating enzyme required for sulfatase activity
LLASGLVLLVADTSSEAQTCSGTAINVGAHEARCIKPGNGERFKDCADCPEMVVVPAGSFMMGSPPDEPEREGLREEQVLVSIPRPFAMGAYPVTRGEFAAFVKATGYQVDPGCYYWTGNTWEERQDTSWQSPGFVQDDQHPVLCIDLKAAMAYAAWLSSRTERTYRLPSEAEREYATRAGTSTPFWWGSTIYTDMANYDGRHTYAGGRTGVWRQSTVRVGSFQPNAWGLYQTHGNVWDWTEDCWNESNPGNSSDGSVRPTGDCRWRVVRGGAWNYAPTYLRAAYRYWNEPENRSSVQGFRVVREL